MGSDFATWKWSSKSSRGVMLGIPFSGVSSTEIQPGGIHSMYTAYIDRAGKLERRIPVRKEGNGIWCIDTY